MKVLVLLLSVAALGSAHFMTEGEKHFREVYATAEHDTVEPSNTRFPWNCEGFQSAAPPTNVHELKPSDIQVVAAVGDSITAGNGIRSWNPGTVLLEIRGESWCIGGKGDIHSVTTIPNMIRQYNPDVRGYSLGTGSYWSNDAWLNQAIPGAIAEDMPFQATRVINRMWNDTNGIDFDNDWKMLTLFIGGNDLCSHCFDRERYSGENYGLHIQEALDRLHAEVPRMLVNLVGMMDITDMHECSTGPMCDGLQWGLCSCAINETTRVEQRDVQLSYYDNIKAIVDTGRYDTRDDFTVVLQPMIVDQKFPRNAEGQYYKDWLSADCFHPNREAHHAFAASLWNTMFISVDEKPTEFRDYESLYCPSADEYIRTRLN